MKIYICPKCKIIFNEKNEVVNNLNKDEKLEQRQCKNCNEYFKWELNKYD